MALPLDSTDLAAIWLTIELASLTTLLLLLIGTPIAWWLARTRSWLKGPIGAVVALPLVLPPTVIGFYLLVSMGPNGFIGQLLQNTREGFFSDPQHGGNRGLVGWKLVGFPGARADFMDWADRGEKYPFPPVAISGERG